MPHEVAVRVQPPAPSQVPAGWETPALQVCAAQVVPVGQWHLSVSVPSQTPSRQVGSLPKVQPLRGVPALPCGGPLTGVHVPTCPATSHAAH